MESEAPEEEEQPSWTVVYTNKAEKSIPRLPEPVKIKLFALVREMTLLGPVRGSWPGYSKIHTCSHHCQLKEGQPTYVCFWLVEDTELKIIEVYYAGTHEKAPY